jgi:hypothetical protein
MAIAAIAPGTGPPQPPRLPGGGGMGPPPPRINLPDVPDDQDSICSCGRGKHMLDQFSTGHWKKICKLCRDEGVKAPKIKGSMRPSLKKQSSSRSLTQSFQPVASIPTKRPSEVPLFLHRGKHSQDNKLRPAQKWIIPVDQIASSVVLERSRPLHLLWILSWPAFRNLQVFLLLH